MRSAAQIVAYEIAMGFALSGCLMVAGSLNLGDIVRAQSGGFFSWFLIPLFPLAVVYFISGVAETNRAPFDVAEGESEIVAGFHVDYSGMAFAVFFLAEYANMIMIAALTAIMFLGGWMSPIDGFGDGIHWFLIKTAFCLFLFLWFRATFPTLSLRSNYALGLEDLYSGYHRLDCRGRRSLSISKSALGFRFALNEN